jgi:hypothetical protein
MTTAGKASLILNTSNIFITQICFGCCLYCKNCCDKNYMGCYNNICKKRRIIGKNITLRPQLCGDIIKPKELIKIMK